MQTLGLVLLSPIFEPKVHSLDETRVSRTSFLHTFSSQDWKAPMCGSDGLLPFPRLQESGRHPDYSIKINRECSSSVQIFSEM